LLYRHDYSISQTKEKVKRRRNENTTWKIDRSAEQNLQP
jgi:hypothetical protein